MKMITTNEASERWGISPRRIAMLASEGRIPGARYEYQRWLIPANSEKPSDGRKRRTNPHAEDKYIFPSIPYCLCFEHPADELNSEETQLLEVYMQYEAGDYSDGLETASELLGATENIYIRIGALYILIFINILLRNYEDAAKTLALFKNVCGEVSEQQPMVFLLEREVEIFFGPKNWITQSFSAADYDASTPFDMAYLAYFSIMKTLCSGAAQNRFMDADLYELTVKRMENDGFYCLSMYYHVFLSNLYALKGNGDQEYAHLKRAFDIAVEKHLFTSMVGLIFLSPDLPSKLINAYPEDIRTKFQKLLKLSVSTNSEFFLYFRNFELYSELSIQDRCLVNYCMKNYTFKTIAEIEGVSLSTVKRQMNALYKKFGVGTKAELIEAYWLAIQGTGTLPSDAS